MWEFREFQMTGNPTSQDLGATDAKRIVGCCHRSCATQAKFYSIDRDFHLGFEYPQWYAVGVGTNSLDTKSSVDGTMSGMAVLVRFHGSH